MTEENNRAPSPGIPAQAARPAASAPVAEGGFYSPGTTKLLAALSVPLAFLPYLLANLLPRNPDTMREAALAGSLLWSAAAAAAVVSGRRSRKLFLLFLLAPIALGPSLLTELRVFSFAQAKGLDLADRLSYGIRELPERWRLPAYGALLAAAPWKYSVLIARGNALREANRPEEALRDFEAADAISPPGNADARFSAAVVYLTRRRFDEARAALDGALERSPGNYNVLRERARLHGYSGRKAEEKADLESMLRSCPPCEQDIYFGQGQFYQGMQRPAEAAEWFSRALALPRQQPALYSFRAHAYMRLKRYAEAAADLDKALAVNPGASEDLLLRAEARLRLGSEAGSISDFTKALELNGGNPELLLKRALAYYYFGRRGEGEADAKKAAGAMRAYAAANPGNAGVLNSVGWALLIAGDWEEAEKVLQETIKLAPGLPYPYGNLANYYWAHKRDKAKALEYLELEFSKGFFAWEDLYSELGDGYFLKGLAGTAEFEALVAKFQAAAAANPLAIQRGI